MQYISSDTNVWLDFATIDRLGLPFKLPYTYIMDEDAVEDELLNPPGIGAMLEKLGLQKVGLSETEYYLTADLLERYARLSLYDCIALSIAKTRNITLLTGDGQLRKAAINEGVTVIGTIGILDQLNNGGYIDAGEYQHCIAELLKYNGGKVRLPEDELRKRLKD